MGIIDYSKHRNTLCTKPINTRKCKKYVKNATFKGIPQFPHSKTVPKEPLSREIPFPSRFSRSDIPFLGEFSPPTPKYISYVRREYFCEIAKASTSNKAYLGESSFKLVKFCLAGKDRRVSTFTHFLQGVLKLRNTFFCTVVLRGQDLLLFLKFMFES